MKVAKLFGISQVRPCVYLKELLAELMLKDLKNRQHSQKNQVLRVC